VGAVVVILKRTNGTEAERILDDLERLIEVAGERFEGGRRFTLLSAADWDAAASSLMAKLNAVSDTWPIHLSIQKPG
jgi:hypothetical protein